MKTQIIVTAGDIRKGEPLVTSPLGLAAIPSLSRLPADAGGMERHRMQVSRFWRLEGWPMVGLSVGVLWRWDRDEWIHVEPVAEIEDEEAEGVFPAGLGVVLTPDEIAEAWVAIDAEQAERAQSKRQYLQARDHCFS